MSVVADGTDFGLAWTLDWASACGLTVVNPDDEQTVTVTCACGDTFIINRNPRHPGPTCRRLDLFTLSHADHRRS